MYNMRLLKNYFKTQTNLLLGRIHYLWPVGVGGGGLTQYIRNLCLQKLHYM